MTPLYQYQIDILRASFEREYQSDTYLATHVDGIARWVTGLAFSVLVACWWIKDALINAYNLGFHSSMFWGFILTAASVPVGILYRVFLYFYMRRSGNLYTAATNRILTIIAEEVVRGPQPDLWQDFYEPPDIKRLGNAHIRFRRFLTGVGIVTVTTFIFGILSLAYAAYYGLVDQYLVNP